MNNLKKIYKSYYLSLTIHYILFNKIYMENYPSGWRGQFAKLLGFVRAARVQIPHSPPKATNLFSCFFIVNIVGGGSYPRQCIICSSFHFAQLIDVPTHNLCSILKGRYKTCPYNFVVCFKNDFWIEIMYYKVNIFNKKIKLI